MKTTPQCQEPQKLITEYTAKRARVEKQLAALQKMIAHHADEPISWAHLGDMGHIEMQLGELLDFVNDQ